MKVRTKAKKRKTLAGGGMPGLRVSSCRESHLWAIQLSGALTHVNAKLKNIYLTIAPRQLLNKTGITLLNPSWPLLQQTWEPSSPGS